MLLPKNSVPFEGLHYIALPYNIIKEKLIN